MPSLSGRCQPNKSQDIASVRPSVFVVLPLWDHTVQRFSGDKRQLLDLVHWSSVPFLFGLDRILADHHVEIKQFQVTIHTSSSPGLGRSERCQANIIASPTIIDNNNVSQLGNQPVCCPSRLELTHVPSRHFQSGCAAGCLQWVVVGLMAFSSFPQSAGCRNR